MCLMRKTEVPFAGFQVNRMLTTQQLHTQDKSLLIERLGLLKLTRQAVKLRQRVKRVTKLRMVLSEDLFTNSKCAAVGRFTPGKVALHVGEKCKFVQHAGRRGVFRC